MKAGCWKNEMKTKLILIDFVGMKWMKQVGWLCCLMSGGLWAVAGHGAPRREGNTTTTNPIKREWTNNNSSLNWLSNGINFINGMEQSMEKSVVCEWSTKPEGAASQAINNQLSLHSSTQKEVLMRWMKKVCWLGGVNFIPFFNHQSKINKTIQSKKFDWLLLIVWIDWLIPLHSIL